MGTSSEDCPRRRLDRLQLWQGPRRLGQERLGRPQLLAEPRVSRFRGCQKQSPKRGCAPQHAALDGWLSEDLGRDGQGCCRSATREGSGATRQGTGCQEGHQEGEERRLVLPVRLQELRLQGGLQGVRSAKTGGRSRGAGRHGGGLRLSKRTHQRRWQRSSGTS
jgi:hypothetical protein